MFVFGPSASQLPLKSHSSDRQTSLLWACGVQHLVVPVDDAAFVQEAQPADKLGGIETGQLGTEPAHLTQVEVQVTAVQKLQHEEQMWLRKENVKRVRRKFLIQNVFKGT